MEYKALGASLKTVSVAEVLENLDHQNCKLEDLAYISTQMYSGLSQEQKQIRDATLKSLDMLVALKKCDLTSNSDQDTETKDVRASKCIRAEIMRVAQVEETMEKFLTLCKPSDEQMESSSKKLSSSKSGSHLSQRSKGPKSKSPRLKKKAPESSVKSED